MKVAWINCLTAGAAILAYVVVGLLANRNHAAALQNWQVTSSISAVPTRPDVSIAPVPTSQLQSSAATAVEAAKMAWGLSDQQINEVVSANISKAGDSVHQH